MDGLKVIRYSSADFELWNQFLKGSKNAPFLFHRNFMEYHQDRFEDFSLMIFSKDKLLSLLPANIVEKEVFSHNGLTYGGLILSKSIKFEKVLEIYKAVLKYLNQNNISQLYIKQIPKIYSKLPTEEMDYLLHLTKAEIYRVDTLSVIKMNSNPGISSNRIEGVKRAEKLGLTIEEKNDFEEFWNEILTINLKEKHNAEPVHSLEEITNLKKSFPKNIRQFNVYQDEQIVAGTTIFESKNVAHSQYISGNELNNQLGSLDFLHYQLIKNVFPDKEYFDFGTSNEKQGMNINKGLQFWKEGFGARTVTQNFYKVATENFNLLDNIFI
ncbi:Acetyltransferase (GNAT) domain-containing protein [Flavobacteriaceae bacterium MAR_2010_188]|nr:Acetyltransferase (GNAT) domain-containing protein [Flavobacteriaceae bacterium MAR_2010_188]